MDPGNCSPADTAAGFCAAGRNTQAGTVVDMAADTVAGMVVGMAQNTVVASDRGRDRILEGNMVAQYNKAQGCMAARTLDWARGKMNLSAF